MFEDNTVRNDKFTIQLLIESDWYRVPPLQSGGIAKDLRSFPSAFERPTIPVGR